MTYWGWCPPAPPEPQMLQANETKPRCPLFVAVPDSPTECEYCNAPKDEHQPVWVAGSMISVDDTIFKETNNDT